MADITVVSTDVRPLVGALVRRFDAGGAVVVGNAVYIAADGDVEKADADNQPSAHARGIAVASGDGALSMSAGDRTDVVLHGPVTGFSGMTQGGIVYTSSTDGNMTQTIPANPDYDHAIGYAESATTIFVNPSSVLPPIG